MRTFAFSARGVIAANHVTVCLQHCPQQRTPLCKTQSINFLIRSAVLCAGYAAQGDFENMVTYSTANGYKPDYLYLMQRMMMDNPEAAVNLAKMVAKQPGPPIDLNTMTDLFLQVMDMGVILLWWTTVAAHSSSCTCFTQL